MFKMDKKIIITLLGILLIITIVAAGTHFALPRHNVEVQLSDRARTQLDSMSLSHPEKSDCIPISEDYCEFKMWKDTGNNEIFHLGTHQIPLRYYNRTSNITTIFTEDILEDLIENMTETKLEEYGNVFANRQERVIPDTRIGGGNVTTRGRR